MGTNARYALATSCRKSQGRWTGTKIVSPTCGPRVKTYELNLRTLFHGVCSPGPRRDWGCAWDAKQNEHRHIFHELLLAAGECKVGSKQPGDTARHPDLSWGRPAKKFRVKQANMFFLREKGHVGLAFSRNTSRSSASIRPASDRGGARDWRLATASIVVAGADRGARQRRLRGAFKLEIGFRTIKTRDRLLKSTFGFISSEARCEMRWHPTPAPLGMEA